MQQSSCGLTVKVMLLQKHSAELKAASTVLVIGGGAVGVELAGKLPFLSVHVNVPVCMCVCVYICCSSVHVPVFACPCSNAFLPQLICLICPFSIWVSLLVMPVWLLLAYLRFAMPFQGF